MGWVWIFSGTTQYYAEESDESENFQFYAEKYLQDAEEAEVGELCGSAPLHPVRCPVKKKWGLGLGIGLGGQ